MVALELLTLFLLIAEKNTIHPPNFLYPNGVVILEAELGKFWFLIWK